MIFKVKKWYLLLTRIGGKILCIIGGKMNCVVFGDSNVVIIVIIKNMIYVFF